MAVIVLFRVGEIASGGFHVGPGTPFLVSWRRAKVYTRRLDCGQIFFTDQNVPSVPYRAVFGCYDFPQNPDQSCERHLRMHVAMVYLSKNEQLEFVEKAYPEIAKQLERSQ